MNITEFLDRERQQLLDIGTRNRLISTPRKSKRLKQIEIVHERSSDLFELIIRQKKAMDFLAFGEDEDEEASDDVDVSQQKLLFLMAAEASDSSPDHFTDTKLQTDLRPSKLQKRLRDFFNDSRTFVEEQGVNPLFMALGFLRWRESESSDKNRFAPLILVPVELERNTVTSLFKLTGSGDDLSTNLSLQQKLKTDFQINLPELPAADDLDVDDYFDKVATAVAMKPEWEVVRDDIQLNFFQFAKFLMYRDLDPENWPDPELLLQNPLLRGLLVDGFDVPEPAIRDGQRIDDHLMAADMIHVVDADSSQMAAIEEVRRNGNLVIQGPPGTGKSQTITNLIATGVREGKKVLFLSEKMAALDVVKQRLDSIGLGDMCLELHSNKSRKKDVLGELNRTLKLRRSSIEVDHSTNSKVDSLKTTLNASVDALHTPAYESGLTPFVILGRLTCLHKQHEFVESVRSKVVLNNATEWTPESVNAMREQLASLVEVSRIIGSTGQHPFRGSNCGILLRSDVDTLRSDLDACVFLVRQLIGTGATLASSIGVSAQKDNLKCRDLTRLGDMANAMVNSPDVDSEAIQHDVWNEETATLSTVVSEGTLFRQRHQRLDGRLNEGALDMSVAEARRHLNAYGRQFFLFRVLNGKYRSAANTLREVLTEAPPRTLDDQLAILDDIMFCQKFSKLLGEDVSKVATCRAAFGRHWKDKQSDWTLLQSTIDWVAHGVEDNLHSKFRVVRARFNGQRDVVITQLDSARDQISQLPALLQRITDRLQLDLQAHFSVSVVDEVPLARLADWLSLAKDQIETLPDWVRYRLKRDDLNQGGLRPLVDLIDDESIDADQAELLFGLTYNEHLLRQLYRDRPMLAEFSGVAHQTTRERFCHADHRMIEATRDEVSNIHRSQIPGGTMGGMKVLRHEIQKKARHKSIRRLLKESGPAIQNVKPVFMMSPLSIAQYLEPGAVEFDLLLIDEASQIEPVDALGAIARCKQIVVVGDDKQLPPTKFFSRSADVDDDDETDTVRELESILGVCNARGLPQRMLMWHYRSQHQSLIAVSNKEYYDNQLFVVPSPIRDSDGYGVKFQFVEDGIYDRGGKANNAIEARVVAQHVIEHARNHSQLSLGVAAFSIKQRDAINNELELLLRDNLDVAHFFQQTGRDAFFTKNLETIQGDERDIIFISVGYGRDADGYMTQSYGPLNRDGGERRLNVLISRAKQKCVVFSSITSEDIDLNRAKARGVVGLKKYLQFAQHGYSDIGEVTGREHDSEFEREVANAIAGYGHTVEAQVGVAGFFIDLAVVDPLSTGRYLLGIECDGASYHSSQSARDRDRLREEVLRNRGWQIHRIWSTDWYQQPDTELKKVLTAIELAQRGDLSQVIAPEQDTSIEVTSASHDDLDNELDAVPSDDEQPSPVASTDDPFGIPVEQYLEASFEIVSATSVLEMKPTTLDKAVLGIVDCEGPVHRDEVARRLASLTNSRAGSRITDAVKKAITRLIRKNEVTRTGEFVDLSDPYTLVVRDRSHVKSPSLKKPENIPPQELALAMALLLKENSNAEKEELIRAVASVVGFRRTGAKFNEAVEAIINEMVESGEFVIRDGVVSIGDWDRCRSRLHI